MPAIRTHLMLEISSDTDTNIVQIVMQGRVKSNTQVCDLVRCVHTSISEIDLDRNMNRLFDVRKLEISDFNAELVRDAASLIQQFNQEWGGIKIADVVADELMYGQHRVLMVRSELSHVDRVVFRSEKSARDWLSGNSENHG